MIYIVSGPTTVNLMCPGLTNSYLIRINHILNDLNVQNTEIAVWENMLLARVHFIQPPSRIETSVLQIQDPVGVSSNMLSI